ncbi:phosphatase PAP2 family protein [Candidatus Woesearchaeota archaeon]|nr:phosphatase PAP2 family protein [Candidatus Woesearchaeota archaeon]
MEKLKFLYKLVIEDFTALGSLVFYSIIMALLLILKRYELVMQLLVAAIIAHLVIMAIKLLFFRDRPKKKKFNNIFEKIDAASFPSAHANRAGLLFVILSSAFPQLYMVVLFAVLSLIVPYTRIYLKKHYLHDVAFGYILGVLEALLVIKLI